MMRVLIAPNAFKHSIDATEVAFAIKEGLDASKLEVTCECFPVGDGGDGTVKLLIEQLGGITVKTAVKDALGRPIKTSFGVIDNGKTAVIEMADASGLKLLQPSELNPLKACSFGTGQQISTALSMGIRRIIIGMGGSATVDGGCGMVQALGARFLDASENELAVIPRDLKNLHSIDLSGLDPALNQSEIIVLCDVDNPLLGEQGSAKIFGPQKGASKEMVVHLEECLAKLSIIVFDLTGRDMSEMTFGGTAGGAAAGLSGLLNAKLVNGIDYFLELTGFENSLAQNDLVITGEGSIDDQTLQGKAPYGVACRAKDKGLPVIGLAGKTPLHIDNKLHQYFDALIPIGHQPLDLPMALQCTSANVKRTAFEVGNLLAMNRKGFG